MVVQLRGERLLASPASKLETHLMVISSSCRATITSHCFWKIRGLLSPVDMGYSDGCCGKVGGWEIDDDVAKRLEVGVSGDWPNS